MLIKAVGVSNVLDFYEIKVRGPSQVAQVMSTFSDSYKMMAGCLRIMGDQMVLLNPQLPTESSVEPPDLEISAIEEVEESARGPKPDAL